MLQIAILERTLNKKTQYFIRTANKRKNPSSVGINDCQYYEFTDGEMKEIDFEQLKKYQKDYEYVTFESNIHGDLRKTDVERIRKFFETGT